MYFRISKKNKISLSAHYNIFFQNKKIFRDFFSFQQFSVKIPQDSISQLLRKYPQIFGTKKVKKTFQQAFVDKNFPHFFHFFFQKNSHHKKDLEKQYYEKILRFKTSKNYFFHLMTKKMFFTIFCQ